MKLRISVLFAALWALIGCDTTLRFDSKEFTRVSENNVFVKVKGLSFKYQNSSSESKATKCKLYINGGPNLYFDKGEFKAQTSIDIALTPNAANNTRQDFEVTIPFKVCRYSGCTKHIFVGCKDPDAAKGFIAKEEDAGAIYLKKADWISAAWNSGTSSVDLSWKAVERANSYDVFRTTNYIESNIATVTSPSYSDTNVSSNKRYSYRISSNSGVTGIFGSSSDRKEVAVPGSGDSTSPAAPTDLSAVSFSETSADVSWTDNASDETGYALEWGTSSSSFPSSATLAANSDNHTVTGLAAGTTYYFRVKAVKNSASSAYSTTESATTLTGQPDPPANLQVFVLNATTINLTWTDGSNNETGFTLERTQTSGDYSSPTTFTTAAGANAYSDTSVSSGQTYYYRLKATRTGYPDSTYTSEVDGTTP